MIYLEVNSATSLNLIQLQEMITERLHQEAIVKQCNLSKEQTRNPRCNWWINHILTFLTMILLYGLGLAAYSMALWTCIMLTDKLFATNKWYWQTLLFIGGHMLAFVVVAISLVTITFYLQTLHD